MAGSSTRKRQEEVVGKLLGGRYRVQRVIGSGGMSTVYAATEEATGEQVALKLLKRTVTEHPDTVDRFVQESLAVALVHHPNVVRSLGAFEDDEGAPIMILELLHGRSLDKVIAEEGPQPIGRAVRIVIDAAEGIGAVHAKGIVHRDLKPANVFLSDTEDGKPEPVKVLDFGVSMLKDPLIRDSAARKTGGGEILGTPQYMAPEQVHDARAADERSDVYALGAILYEMLTGWAPFRAKTYPMLIVEILTATPPPIAEHRRDCPPELAAAIHRAISKKPEERFPTMAAFAEAIRAFAGIDTPAPPVKPPDPEPSLKSVIERSASSVPPLTRGPSPALLRLVMIIAVILVAAAVIVATMK